MQDIPATTIVVPVVQVRSIILASLGLLLSVAFGKLVLDSGSSVPAEVGEKDLQKALAQYQRSEQALKVQESLVASQGVTQSVRATEKHRTAGRKSDQAASRIPAPRSTDSQPTPRLGAETTDTNTNTNTNDNEDEPDEVVNAKTRMDDANHLYDRGDDEGARDAALVILESDSKNVRMQRIVVSSSCIMGDEDTATKYYRELPKRDQLQMAKRCKRYGIDFDTQDQ